MLFVVYSTIKTHKDNQVMINIMATIVSIGSLVTDCGTPVTQVDRKAVAQGKELYHTLACDPGVRGER